MIKIAFVYEFGQEEWSTPYSLIAEFRERGYHVDRYYFSDEGVDLLYNNKKEYDIIFSLDWKGLEVKKLNKKVFDNSFLITELADCPQNFEKHSNKIGKYHCYLCPDYTSTINYMSLCDNVVWFNHFADTKIHHEYGESDTLPSVRSTRGPGGSQFMEHLSYIMPNKFINRNGLHGENYGKFLSNGKIVLQNSRWKEITRRIFEGMACGKLVITDRLPENTNIDKLFVENEDIVYYDGISDCISKINYYLCDEGEQDRLRIAKNGYLKTIKNHTQKNRVDLILENYVKWKENSQL